MSSPSKLLRRLSLFFSSSDVETKIGIQSAPVPIARVPMPIDAVTVQNPVFQGRHRNRSKGSAAAIPPAALPKEPPASPKAIAVEVPPDSRRDSRYAALRAADSPRSPLSVPASSPRVGSKAPSTPSSERRGADARRGSFLPTGPRDMRSPKMAPVGGVDPSALWQQTLEFVRCGRRMARVCSVLPIHAEKDKPALTYMVGNDGALQEPLRTTLQTLVCRVIYNGYCSSFNSAQGATVPLWRFQTLRMRESSLDRRNL
jgi:hypothetical protein